MRIYPKISDLNVHEKMKEIIKQSRGVEIQYFDEKDILEEFNFENLIKDVKKEYPHLEEIIVHPPLDNYHLELLTMKDKEIVKRQLSKLKELSLELNINLYIIYHTLWTKEQYRATKLAETIKNEYLPIIENSNVEILIENLFMMLDEKEECSAIEIAKYINHSNLKVCIDTTHMHCKANILKKDFNQMVENELNKEDCEKYVRQIHFASAIKNDGYIDKKTHGRVHETQEVLQKEYNWLSKLGMGSKTYITEVSEDDYYTRVDQIKEIEMLKQITK